MVQMTAVDIKKKDPSEIKKKRPWRNKVRKLAMKKAAQEARAAAAIANPPEPKIVGDGESLKKKKKKRRKKRKDEEKSDEPMEDGETASPLDEAKKKLEAGRFRFINEKLYTMTGSDAVEYFKEDPKAFDCYHKGFGDQVKKWPNHPLKEIVRWVEKHFAAGSSIFDLGCGEAKLAEKLGEKYKVRSFDLVAVNDRVEACDMAKLPAEDATADVVVYCLSLMGTNLYDFIKEARRVLKLGGTLKIAEVTSRFVKVNMFCEAIAKMGFELKMKKALTDYFTMLEFVKIEKVANKRPFGLKLNPCLYKKR